MSVDAGIRSLSEHPLRTVGQSSPFPNQSVLFLQQLFLEIRLPPPLVDLDITPLPQRPLQLPILLPLAGHLNIMLLLLQLKLCSSFSNLLISQSLFLF